MAWRRLRAPRAEISCHSPFKNSERTCLATVRCLLHKRFYRPHHQHQTEKAHLAIYLWLPDCRWLMVHGAMGSEVQELQGEDSQVSCILPRKKGHTCGILLRVHSHRRSDEFSGRDADAISATQGRCEACPRMRGRQYQDRGREAPEGDLKSS